MARNFKTKSARGFKKQGVCTNCKFRVKHQPISSCQNHSQRCRILCDLSQGIRDIQQFGPVGDQPKGQHVALLHTQGENQNLGSENSSRKNVKTETPKMQRFSLQLNHLKNHIFLCLGSGITGDHPPHSVQWDEGRRDVGCHKGPWKS